MTDTCVWCSNELIGASVYCDNCSDWITRLEGTPLEEISTEFKERQKHAIWFVYFIQCNDYIKIGKSTGDVQLRLKEMQTGNPYRLDLLRIIPYGEPYTEGNLHYRFKHLSHRGEWFEYTDELERFIWGLPDFD